MSLLVPAALGLATLVVPLVALYMLRGRRQRVPVPSIMLWQGAGPSVSSATPWQRLRVTPLLLLQLLILAAFVTVLARPFFEQATDLGPHTVLVLDTSGSMAMGKRFERAQAEARRLVADASADHLVSLVAAGARPRVVAAFSAEPGALRNAIDGLAAGGASADLGAAIRVGRSLAAVDRPTTVMLLSDGGAPEDAAPVEEPAAGVIHLLFDDVAPNRAITSFAADDAGGTSGRVFLEVTNFGDEPVEAAAELTVEGTVAAVVDFELGSRQRMGETVALDAGPGDVIEARLVGNGDGLPLDDRARLVVGSAAVRRVDVAGDGSAFLDALLAAAPGFEATDGAGGELVIVDRADPAEAAGRPGWFVATDPLPPGVTAAGWIENTAASWQRPGDPLLDDVDLSSLAIGRAQIVTAPGWVPLVRAGDVPLVLVGEVDGRRAVLFTFELEHSNLPVQVSFPILGARLLDWLAGVDGDAGAAEAGTPIPLAPPPGAQATVTMPDGEVRDVAPGVTLFDDTEQPGVYRVAYVDAAGAETPGPAAARLFAGAESAGAFRELATAGAPGGADGGTLIREWAPRLLVILLLLSLAEWWLGHGRPGRPRPARSGEEAAPAPAERLLVGAGRDRR